MRHTPDTMDGTGCSFARGSDVWLRRLSRLTALLLLLGLAPIHAADRFPKPDFEASYHAPQTVFPGARPGLFELADGLVLALALGVGAWLVHRRRSRRGVYVLMLFCLGYFGFWKQGCVCAVGSVQNVSEALANPGQAISLGVLAFFALPLLCALFFGRIFCAAVCPLGAIQDVVALRPRRLSPWLAEALSLVPYVYLGLAVLLAATGTAYLICRFDPFVAFFRLSGSAPAFFIGVVFLALGVIVARPYCRFLCPYGVLLGWASRLSWKRVSVTPSDCIQCRLCEDACPFDAIRAPTPERPPETRRVGVRRTAAAVLSLPFLVLLGIVLGSRLGHPLSELHEDTRLVRALAAEEAGASPPTVDTTAFRDSARSVAELQTAVAVRRQRLDHGGGWLGACIGLVIGIKLIRRSLLLKRRDYEPDQAHCLACARCYRACPMPAAAAAGTTTSEETIHGT